MKMDPIQIISRYYPPESPLFTTLITHSQAVAKKAAGIAEKIGLNEALMEFIHEAAMLHDIGIFLTSAPEIGCNGKLPYLCHGYLGHDLLLREGLPKHALVCERHTGTGLNLEDVGRLPKILPYRPLEPVSLEEKLIAYCDKFFSKDPGKLEEERSVADILDGLRKYGDRKAAIFTDWHEQFSK